MSEIEALRQDINHQYGAARPHSPNERFKRKILALLDRVQTAEAEQAFAEGRTLDWMRRYEQAQEHERSLRVAVERLAEPSLSVADDGMIHHGNTGHSGGLQCDKCPGYPHAECVSKAELRALTTPADQGEHYANREGADAWLEAEPPLPPRLATDQSDTAAGGGDRG